MTNTRTFSLIVIIAAASGAACSAPPSAEEQGLDNEVQQDGDYLISRAVALRIPVIDDSGKLISRHNTRLRAMGEAAFPDFVTVSNTTGPAPFRALRTRWDSISSRISSRAEGMRAFSDPSTYTVTGSPSKRLCYTGNPYYLGAFLQSLSDSVMSDQFYLVGWKSGRGVFVESDMREYASDFPRDWAGYSTARRDVMVLFVTNDDGDDFTTNAIPRCTS